MRLTTIRVHPLKSARGLELERADVEPWGLAGDRRWTVVGADGEGLHARDYPQLLAVRATLGPAGALLLAAPGRADLAVPPPDPAVAPRILAGRLGPVVAAGLAGDAWVSALLGRPARLAWQADPTERPVTAQHGGRPGDVTSLADDAPLLLTSEASLNQVNDWIAGDAVERGEQPPAPLAMARFRPNVVIAGAPAFAEDDWKRLRIGALEFHVAEACDRCVMTTYDPDSLAKGKEPIRTLSRHRKWDGKTWFGIRLTPDGTGRLAVGDPVQIIG
jgi:uncharacterized protein YcbX